MKTEKTLQKARRLARIKYNELIEGEYAYYHPSHAADIALQYAADKAGLPHFGVEGMCELNGDPCDLQHINMGDTYDLTVCFYGGRFLVSSWGDIVERATR